jgi:hypothetical protein
MNGVHLNLPEVGSSIHYYNSHTRTVSCGCEDLPSGACGLLPFYLGKLQFHQLHAPTSFAGYNFGANLPTYAPY